MSGAKGADEGRLADDLGLQCVFFGLALSFFLIWWILSLAASVPSSVDKRCCYDRREGGSQSAYAWE